MRFTIQVAIAAALLLFPSQMSLSQAAATPIKKSVRVVYLVSKDRKERADFKNALSAAATEMRQWYAGQLGGRTFKLNTPVVEVALSDKKADWFRTNPNDPDKDHWGYFNALTETARLMGAKLNDPDYIWVVYSDGPNDKGRGGNGFAYLPEDDLLGLIGKHPTQPNAARWVGGLGHELGHALGLGHPPGCADQPPKNYDAIMCGGFYSYPGAAYLTVQDKLFLTTSPFIH